MTNETKNVVIPQESAEAVKQNLRQVAEEIAKVRDAAREEAESLERIRGMIDLKYLNDLLSAIDNLESRIKKMEQGAELRRWKKELETEQGRLAKLWDAFKTQEDELKAVARERDEILEQFRALEKELGTLGSPSQIRHRITTLEAENRRLELNLNSSVDRAERNSTMFAQEQERLAKLYKVYEDAQSQLQKLRRASERRTKAKRTDPFAFARAMKEVRARARSSKGGKGPIAKRAAAKRLRRKFGVKGKKK